ncbi:T9SS type A sorting domain-containing protein [bacterium]|nr:T9SS type A sorting domain-containing protein [bacterium]
MKIKNPILAALIAAISIFAQSGDVQIEEIIKSDDCETIYTMVCVFDSLGRYTPELELEDFSFSENGTPVVPPSIRQLNECPAPYIDIVLLMDFSGSMDDDVSTFSSALSIFTAGLAGIDYRICIAIFNGCPAEINGLRHMVLTDFSAAPPCTVGTDMWADNPTDFYMLFQATLFYYSLPWALRGSGHEDQYGALHWIIDTLDWRPGCHKAVVMFTDEEVQIVSPPCLPYYDYSDSSLYQIMDYCSSDSVTFFAVCPPDSDMEWYPLSGDSPDRAYYAGYRVLAESTGGIWSDLYDAEYSAMVESLGLALGNIPCCYEFEYLTSKFCELTDVIFNVVVENSVDFIGWDDSTYNSFCEPRIDILMPSPCGGITSCANQWIKVLHTNPEYGYITDYNLGIKVDGIEVAFDVSIAGDTMFFFPETTFAHRDTVVFEFVELVNNWGCIGVESPCTFYVDLQPPELIYHYPSEDDTLFVGEVSISANLIDEFSGISPLSIPARIDVTMDSDTLDTSGPIWTLHEDTAIVSIDTVIIERSGVIRVCISELFDSPDYCYCSPNQMEPTCWEFFAAAASREVGFPIMFGAPCDTVLIPLSIDGLEMSVIGSAEMTFTVDPNVLIPLGLVTSGTLTDGWLVDTIDIDEETGLVSATIIGAPLSSGSGGDFLFLRAIVNCDALGGQYTSIDITGFEFNLGFPLVETSDGFFYVTLTPEVFTCDLYLNRTHLPNHFDRVVTFGATWGAGDSYDYGIDIIDVPAPDWMVDGRFVFDDAAYPHIAGLLRDIRCPFPPRAWNLATFDEPNGTIHWNPADLPEGEFRLEGIVDMKRDSTATYGLNDTLLIEWFFPEFTYCSLTVHNGWNMVSSPVLPTVVPAQEVFNTMLSVYRYSNEMASYRNAELIQEGQGYWIWADSSYAIMTVGGRLDSYSRIVFNGWNLIGAPFEAVSISEIEIFPSGGIIGDIFAWDGSEYYSTDSLRPGCAYWLLSSSDGILEVPFDGSRKFQPKIPIEWTGTIEIIADGEMATLSIAYSPMSNSDLCSGDIAIPPLTPYSSERIATLIKGDIQLSTSASDGEWTILLREEAIIRINVPVMGEMFIDDKRVNDNPVSIGVGLHKLKFKNILPEEMTLIGCYPNPFNTTATILLTLPSEKGVRLEVFDISGRRVNSFDREMSAGLNRITWDGLADDGSQLPSGLYLFRAATGVDEDIIMGMLIK